MKAVRGKLKAHKSLAKKASFSKFQLISVALIFAVAGGYVIFKSFAAAPTLANLWVDTNGGTCTRQATAGAYIDTQACGSFDAAWDAASAGDTIVVKSATYGAQTITGNKTSPTSIIAEDGTTLSGSPASCPYSSGLICANADYMVIQNLTVNAGSSHGQSSGAEIRGSNITFRNVNLYGSYVSLYIVGANFTWQNGKHGQDGALAGQRRCSNADGQPVWVEDTATGAVIDGIKFNPMGSSSNAPECGADNTFHMEYIRVQETQNVTIKNNYFVADNPAIGGSGSGKIFITSTSPSSTADSGLTLMNNVFEPVDGSYAIQTHSNVSSCATWNFAYNTFEQPVLLSCTNTTGMKLTGNLGPDIGCDAGSIHIKNVWQRSTSFSCGTDVWVNGPNNSVSNLGIGAGGHLNSGSPAINAAETNTATDFCTGGLGSVDFEGNVRPAGSACDAGAYEYGSAPASSVANLWIDTNGGSCTRQATAGAYVDAQACSSIAAAISAATSGDMILIQDGTYPGEEFSGNKTLSFQAAGPGRPAFGQFITNASNMTFKHITVENRAISWSGNTCSYWDYTLYMCGNNNTFDDVIVDGLLKGKAQGDNNRLGGVEADGSNFVFKNGEIKRIRDNKGFQGGGDGMLIENNLIHDVGLTAAGAAADVHLECAAVTGGNNQVWRRNKFYDCSVINWVAQNYVNGPVFGPVTLENNFFAHPMQGDVNGSWQSGAPCLSLTAGQNDRNAWNNWVIRYNTFECGIIVVQTVTTADDNASAQWYGNLGADPGCGLPEWTIHHNVGSVCASSTGNVVVANALNNSSATNQSPFYVNAPAYDFHLKSGVAAIDKGDPANYPAVDLDGVSRTNPPDAGSYEYTGGGTSPSPQPSPQPQPQPSPSPSGILLGNQTVETQSDQISVQQAEAWPFTAISAGNAGTVSLNLANTSTAQGVLIGLYSDSSGSPGSLLASATISAPVSGWNTANLSSTPGITVGTVYWVAVLGTGSGNVIVTDRGGGTCTAKINAAPNNWTSLHNPFGATGGNFSDCPLSAYVSAVAGSNRKNQGDLNNDNIIDITDLSILLSNYNTASITADINGDNIVDIFDLSILLTNYGT